MSWNASDAGRALTLAALVAFFGHIFWSSFRQRQKRPSPVGDESSGSPYRVFTREFDVVARAQDIPKLLLAVSPDQARGWLQGNDTEWRIAVGGANAVATAEAVSFAEQRDSLRKAFAAKGREWVIVLLIDQSGSMKGERIAHVAANVRWLSHILSECGVAVAILGFSTVGWQGGRSRAKWIAADRPKRPGRLCALLHVIYAEFGDPLSDAAFEAMLDPDLLRENVDGEALLWANEMLAKRSEPHKLLIVLSDGAPVDDSTLMQNGPSYLERHLLSVIKQIDSDPAIHLGAVGVGYAVDRYYRRSRSAIELNDLPAALAGVLTDTVQEIPDQP